MSAPSQRVRVLNALERAGQRGITAVSFLAPDVIDGGLPVLRVGARIDDLRRAGHAIGTTMEQVGGARLAVYRLAPARHAEPVTPEPQPAGEQEALAIAIAPARGKVSPFDPWVDA